MSGSNRFYDKLENELIEILAVRGDVSNNNTFFQVGDALPSPELSIALMQI